MKLFVKFLFAACLAAMTVSCTKEINENNGNKLTTSKGTISVSVTGLMGEYTPVTKSELVNSVRVAWKGGEIVYVFDEYLSCLGYLTATVQENDDRVAILNGEITAPYGDKLYLVHSPAFTADNAPESSGRKLSVSLAEQDTNKAPFVVYSTIDCSEDQESIENLIASFSFATSVIRVSCTGLAPGTAISSAEISNVYTSCDLSIDSEGAVVVSGSVDGVITRSNADGFNNVNAEGDASFQFAVPALSTSTSRTLTVFQGENEYLDEKFSTASITPNLSVNTICTMISKDTINPDSPVGTVGVIDGRKAVVVSLYGTKYAVALMNEGATSESGPGSYGGYYDYAEASAFFHDSALNVWRVPTMDEMQALTDLPREYDSTTPGIEFKVTGSSILFPLAGLYSLEGGFDEVGNVYYYTSTLLEGGEGDIVCFMNREDVIIYTANSAPDSFKLSLRLFYQLTEINKDVIHGRFTVNAEGKQVCFSKGNLQATYNGRSYSWGFARNQYEIIGEGNEDIAAPVNGTTLDLFGWSTYATDFGISTSNDARDYNGAFIDWGKAFDTKLWRTLSIDEWDYLINERTVNDGTGLGYSWAWASVEGVYGIILFHDGYYGITEGLDTIPNDCVFLPAAGLRSVSDGDTRTQTEYEPGTVSYWSASPASLSEPKSAQSIRITEFPESEYFDPSKLEVEFLKSSRNLGFAVRLVSDCN